MEKDITMQEDPTTAAQSGRQENERLRELLREDSELQRQFDRMVSRSLATARGKWERERDAEIQQAALIRDAEREAALEGREAALRSRAAIDEIVMIEGLQADEEEIANALAIICRHNDITMEELKEQYDAALEQAVINSVLTGKVMRLIRDAAEVTVV